VITRRTKLQLLAFLAVSLLGISYLAFNYVGLDRVLLGSGYEVAADFEDSGGIFVNAEVTYRGVAVGRVSDMSLTEDGVRVVMTIDPDAEPIPDDAAAAVANRSAVGEQYVDLRPERADGPYLADGAVIPRDRTSIPIPVEQLLLDVDQLANSLDEENLRIVVDELGQAFAGSGDDLGRLIDNGDLLLARAEESLPQTLRLITDGQTVLDTQVDSRSAIRAWARDLRRVTDTLVDLDPEFRELVVNAPDAGAALEQLVHDAGPGLGGLVRNLDILNRVQLPRMAGIEQMLVTYPDVVSGGFTVVRRDEDGQVRSHFGFVPNPGEPHSCTSGYVSTTSTPSAGAVAAVDPDRVRCRVVDGRDPQPADGYDESGSSIRGEQNIGRNGGVGAPTSGGGLPGGGGPAPELPTDLLDDVLGGLLSATPLTRAGG
jgi:phospholipid/cholesterol/gamma-HCH transport system substrate-binding protein